MNLSASERATLNFYQWEYLGRGYYHFDEVVEIEPPYRPFTHKPFEYTQYIDDGRVPSVLERVVKLFDKPKPKEEEIEEISIVPSSFVSDEDLKCFTIAFQPGQDITPEISAELLSMLSFSSQPISFEIMGSREKITIQFVCAEADGSRVQAHLKAYFPGIIIQEQNPFEIPFDLDRTVAIADFGLQDEFMRPLVINNNFNIDPLTSIIATLDNLREDEVAITQVIFKGVEAPWSKSIINSVSDGVGGSFFVDAPEMLSCAIQKVADPLFSAVIRVGAQGKTDEHSQYLSTQLIQSITSLSRSEYNRLIPLSNEGYDYEHHLKNIYHRSSNRLGMILNGQELATFVHYPNKSVVSEKLGLYSSKTKAICQEAVDQKYLIGMNSHNGVETKVTLSDEARLKHTHIIGATGVGKSTLIANMILEDMQHGNGCALLDPHGDIVDDILSRIPEHRKDDVILIDPSDNKYSIGFNLLGASTDAEKVVLSSDLVSAFKRHATAWGDNMTAVLSNAINTFLESSRTGTLIELKRFILEEKFRNEFLKTVEDPSLHYYWKHEYPMVRKGIAPLLTRIDTFLRPKIVRFMLSQTGGVDFKKCIERKKILLIKLSQGLIGEENSYLLGSLFLAKINQVAQGRQLVSKDLRHPYYLYIDEFQNFITPSIRSILSGARKYGLGLVLAHQELAQIEDAKTLNSIISNPYTRICFRLGDADAKRLESGFIDFESSDLQSLEVGQTIIRVGSNKNDFNMRTFPMPEILDNSRVIKNEIVHNSRLYYGLPISEVQVILNKQLPQIKGKVQSEPDQIAVEDETESITVNPAIADTVSEESISDAEREKLVQRELESVELRTHTYLQSKLKKLGQERGFIGTVECPTSDGGRIDLVLERDELKIGIEISETNTPEYEIENIKKCLREGCKPVLMVSKSQEHLNRIQVLAAKELSQKDVELVRFVLPADLLKLLDGLNVEPIKNEEVIKGFRITTEYEETNDSKHILKNLTKILRNKS